MIDKDDYCNGSWQVNMSERKEFEKVFKSYYPQTGDFYLGMDENGNYHDVDTRVAFNIYQLQQKKIDALKALNPDVQCPARGCNGTGYISTQLGPIVCGTCDEKGTVPLAKAQEYRIKELEELLQLHRENDKIAGAME